jgi:SAM-dependent methyltransferase
MTPDRWVVTIVGLALVAFIVWFFGRVLATGRSGGSLGARRCGVATRSGELARGSIARSFDAFAPSWDRKHGPVGLRRLALAVRTAYLRRLCQQLGRPRALDIGCGTGHQLLTVSDRISEGLGIDISTAMIAQARANARNRGLDDRLRFKVLAGEDIRPESVGTFDLIMCIGSLEHMADTQAVLARIASLLRPHGILILVMAHPWHPRSLYTRFARRAGLIPPFQYLAPYTLCERMHAVGLHRLSAADVTKGQRHRLGERLTVHLPLWLTLTVSGSYLAVFTAKTAHARPVALVHNIGPAAAAVCAHRPDAIDPQECHRCL